MMSVSQKPPRTPDEHLEPQWIPSFCGICLLPQRKMNIQTIPHGWQRSVFVARWMRSQCRCGEEGEGFALVAREVYFVWAPLVAGDRRGRHQTSELHSLQYAIISPLKVNRRFVCEKYSYKIFCSWKDNTIPCFLLGCTILIMSGNLSYFIFHIYLWNKLLANRTLFQII